MKKIFCLFLSVVIVIGIITSMPINVFAATTEVTGGTTQSGAHKVAFSSEYGITLDGSATKWFKFTTNNSSDYWYNISVKNVSVGNNNGFRGVSGTIYDSFGEALAYASAFSGDTSIDGAKLEAGTTYYIAIYGCREGKIKFWIDAEKDDYPELKEYAPKISFNTFYETSIDSCGDITDERAEDGIASDVDYVSFESGKSSKIKFTLNNGDVEYYNTYFEGVVGKIVDSFGSTYCYVEVRPGKEESVIVELEKNQIYYIKFFASSDGMGKYKFKIECNHTESSWLIDTKPTCVKEGLRYKECMECQKCLVTEKIFPLGHNYGSWVVDKETTCTETGARHKACLMCGDIVAESISATGHKTSSWITDKKATVNAAGKKHKECTECGEFLETATIAQLKCSKSKLKTISNTSSGVKITWSKVSGADSYEVYRKVKGGSYSKVGTTSKTYFTDKKAKTGKKYYYVIKAVNEVGKSDSSSSLSKYYLADPTLKTPSTTTKGIELKWSKVAGAQGYIVYRKTGSGSYKKIKTEKGVSNLSYVDKSAKKGKKYTYKVKAYYSKTYSAYSNTKTIKDKY